MKIGNLAEQPTPTAAAITAPAANGTVDASSACALAAKADASAGIAACNAASTMRSGAATSHFDAASLAPISKAIDIGSFKINPEAIADKLIANAQELLAQVRR